MNKDLQLELILDKYLDKDNLSQPELKLLEQAKAYFIEKSNHNMGIGSICAGYIFVNKNQDTWQEFSKIQNFLYDYVKQYAQKQNKPVEDFDLEFINYGRTQLVYVLTDKITKEKRCILVKQSIVEYGKIKQEAENLQSLKSVDDNVIAPLDYFAANKQELYVTPYIEQARCIASDTTWGMYIPEPFYRFESFSREQEQIVNCCMIAKLVSLYNFDKKQGIAACKLGGGDFMLPKGWEKNVPTIENTLNNLYLIAAREMINCSFDEYIGLIKSEFSRKTINENQEDLLLNKRGRVAMQQQDINLGITLGKQIIDSRKCELEN